MGRGEDDRRLAGCVHLEYCFRAMKVGPHCQQTLPLSDFSTDRKTGYVFRTCRECCKRRIKEWRQENRELLNLRDRLKRLRDPEKVRREAREYYQQNKEAVNAAIKRGRLKFPEKN